MSPDGRDLTVEFENGLITGVDLRLRVLRFMIQTNKRNINGSELILQGQYLVIATSSGDLQLWDTAKSSLIEETHISDCRVGFLATAIIDRQLIVVLGTPDSGLQEHVFTLK